MGGLGVAGPEKLAIVCGDERLTYGCVRAIPHGHPAAAQAYAWSPRWREAIKGGSLRCLHQPPITSPVEAERAAARNIMETGHESEDFHLSWNVDLNRLENEINVFLAMLPGNAVKHVQSAASSTRTRDTDQMQTDYLVTVWYEGEPKKPTAKKSARR